MEGHDGTPIRATTMAQEYTTAYVIYGGREYVEVKERSIMLVIIMRALVDVTNANIMGNNYVYKSYV